MTMPKPSPIAIPGCWRYDPSHPAGLDQEPPARHGLASPVSRAVAGATVDARDTPAADAAAVDLSGTARPDARGVLWGRIMNGHTLMTALIGVYVIVAIVFATEGNWPKTWYWLAAAQITASVLVMK